VVTAYSLFVAVVIVGGVFGVKYRTTWLPVAFPGVRPIVFQPTREETRQDAMQAASKPVTWTTNTLTEADIQKQQREFRVRQWLEGYRERGDRSEARDSEAVQYIETWIARNYGGQADTNPLTTAQWSDKLANDPSCTDPLVLTLTGVNSIELHEQEKRLRRALERFNK
jgi:hypothetical protein